MTEEVLKGGLMTKRGAVRKNWKLRYFTLTERSLSYAPTEGAKSIRSIPLCPSIVVAKDDSMKPHCFTFKTRDRTFFLIAQDDDDREEWVVAIQGAVNAAWDSVAFESARGVVLQISAENLASADVNGKSDPMISMRRGKLEAYRSEVIKKTLSPAWNEFEVGLDPREEGFVFKIYDWDRVGDNDRIGKVKVSFDELIHGDTPLRFDVKGGGVLIVCQRRFTDTPKEHLPKLKEPPVTPGENARKAAKKAGKAGAKAAKAVAEAGIEGGTVLAKVAVDAAVDGDLEGGVDCVKATMNAKARDAVDDAVDNVTERAEDKLEDAVEDALE